MGNRRQFPAGRDLINTEPSFKNCTDGWDQGGTAGQENAVDIGRRQTRLHQHGIHRCFDAAQVIGDPLFKRAPSDERADLDAATSAGKSSVAEMLQRTLPAAYLTIGVDDFLAMLPDRRHGSADGVSFAPQAEGEMPLHLGPAGQTLERAFHRAVRAAVNQGLRVIVDDVLFESWLLDDWLDVLDGVQVLFVGIVCPLSEPERREQSRGDRQIGLARAQINKVHAHECYDVTVDTSVLSAEAAASKIAAALKADDRQAFASLRTRRSKTS